MVLGMDKNKEEFYKSATRKLLSQLDKMNMNPADKLAAKKLTLLFRNKFQDYDVKMATFGPDLNYDISMFSYDADGFCKASSFTFMNQLNPRDWQLMYINELWTFGPHHYLMHLPSRTVFDLTADQYTQYGIDIPYNMGYPVSLDKHESQSAERFARALALQQKQND